MVELVVDEEEEVKGVADEDAGGNAEAAALMPAAALAGVWKCTWRRGSPAGRSRRGALGDLESAAPSGIAGGDAEEDG